jgi:hypothetical protein
VARRTRSKPTKYKVEIEPWERHYNVTLTDPNGIETLWFIPRADMKDLFTVLKTLARSAIPLG